MNSKIRFLIAAALFPFLFLSQSCEKIKDAASFNQSVDLPTETIVLDSATYKSSANLLEWKVLKEYPVSVDVQKILDDNDLSSADFSEGRFESASVRVIDPEGVTFSFANKMYIALSLDPNFSSEVKVAETDNIPANATSVTFNIFPTDITSFIKADEFYTRLYGYKVGQIPAAFVSINLDSKIKVKVNPI